MKPPGALNINLASSMQKICVQAGKINKLYIRQLAARSEGVPSEPLKNNLF